MNYEVKPFQDRKSITIDELKGQTSELLDRATAERQPLRVSMKDGREFLLFPQELLNPLCDNDFRLIVLSAMRYAMGRDTYMPLVVTDYISNGTSGCWTTNSLCLLPMIFGVTLRTTGSTSRIRLSGRSFWRRLKQSRETESPDQRRRAEPVPYAVCH